MHVQSGSGAYIVNNQPLQTVNAAVSAHFVLLNSASITVNDIDARGDVIISATQGDVKIGGVITAGRDVVISSENGLIHLDPPILAVGQINLTAHSGMLIEADVISSTSSVRLVTASGLLQVFPGIKVEAGGGSVLLQNLGLSSGSIVLSENSHVSSKSQTPLVQLIIGTIPNQPTAGTAPSTITVDSRNGGQVYFGASGISASCCSTIVVDGGTVQFDTNGQPSDRIFLGPNVRLSASSSTLPIPHGHGGEKPSATGQPPGLNGITVPVITSPTIPPGQAKPKGGDIEPPGHRGTPPGQQKKAQANEASDSEFVSVAFVSPSVLVQTPQLQRSSDNMADVWATGGPKHNCATGHLLLHDGEFLIRAKKNVTLQWEDNSIHLRSGAVVSIEATPGLLQVRNLLDARNNSVKILIDQKNSIGVSAGEQLILSIDQRKPSSQIAFRRPHYYSYSKKHVVTAEHSMLSLATRSPLMKKVMGSTDPLTMSVSKKILKMAACITQVTSSHGCYESE